MYRTAFPRCNVSGPVDPVPYSHFLSGAVPSKCKGCTHLFEGSCRRAIEQAQGDLSLDHGTCPVNGPTEPVQIETNYYKSKVYIPAKCERCLHLKLDPNRGFVCNLDHQLWGAFPRTLDWGAWSPDHPNLGLRSGRSVSQEVLNAVAARDEIQAIKAFRSSHKDATLREARDAYAELLENYPRSGS